MRTPEENYEAAALELAAYRLMQREQDDIDTTELLGTVHPIRGGGEDAANAEND